MLVLRQSTAVDVLIGPFVDITDGITGETGESPAVKLSKNGQALGAKNDATTPVSDADGYYNCELDATDTNTVGNMVLTVAATATAAPVRHELQILEEAVYDDLYGASAAGYAGITELATAQTDLDIITDSDGVILGAAGVDLIWDEVLTGATHNVTNSSGRRLRQIDAAFEVHSGTAQSGSTANTIVLDTGADATNDDIYRGDRCVIVAGTGIGEHGLAISYAASTRILTMSEDWIVTPDNTSEFILVPADCDVETWNHNKVTGDGDWAELQTDVDDILLDTNELQADDVPGLIAALDTVVDGLIATVGVAGLGLSDLGGMSTAMKAEVNVEVADVVNTDTQAEPTSVPAANASMSDKIDWLFMLARNTGTQTATTKTIKADDTTTTVGTSTVSDDGTTFTRTEYV